jgi:hypothetical protein
LTERDVLFIKTKQIWGPFIRLKHMGAIKPQPVFGLVKPAVLVTVTATQSITSSGITQDRSLDSYTLLLVA